ncbi:telomeric repeat binding factor a [Austrofundulus limnaeus]|uniref:Telomeric repeat binding factor a n=1 Tax=Austrofundulus limnaeus TaxID=52670 RepID=A0A2I4CKF6_AUSLI|nr:PREDICTED: telomeric repeat-binding factor 2 [Austrofundulus limnaeus]
MMATEENVNNHLNRSNHEKVVNRWTAEYYIHLALEFFRKEQYTDFCGYTNIINRILDQPVEKTDLFLQKIGILQFLSHISDAEKLDQSFECDQNKTPLESALLLLESMTKEFSLPQHDCENVGTSLKEMIVGTFIKNGQFEKAKEAFNQYFHESTTSKRTVFLKLIHQKKKTHEVIKQLNFQSFKKEMADFCQRLFSFSPPFLFKAAEMLVRERQEPDDTTHGIDEQSQPISSHSPQISRVELQIRKPSPIQRIRLEMAFNALAEGPCQITFDQLTREVDTEAQEHEICLQLTPDPMRGTILNSELDVLIQRDSCSPMEASPADQPPQADKDPQTQAGSLSAYTVPRLLAEPDSQPSSQCITAAEELETEEGTKQQPQTVSSGSKTKDAQFPVTDKEVITPRRSTRLNRTSSVVAVCSAENDKDSDSDRNKEVNDEDLHDGSNQSFSRKLNKSKDSSEREDEPQAQSTPAKTPTQRPPESLSPPPSKKVNSGDIEDCTISDSSLDSSPTVSSRPPVSKSSTPRIVMQPISKWKDHVRKAVESKDTWSDDDSEFNFAKNSRLNKSTTSNTQSRKRMWTDSETDNLIEGVNRFGEGNWSKILSYYSFENRTNINLKDRWRTMKKLKMV